VSMP